MISGISADLLGEHRLYDVEVLDFSNDVSFILLMPPRDLVCSSFKSQTKATGVYILLLLVVHRLVTNQS